jgi:hypothetical protein
MGRKEKEVNFTFLNRSGETMDHTLEYCFATRTSPPTIATFDLSMAASAPPLCGVFGQAIVSSKVASPGPLHRPQSQLACPPRSATQPHCATVRSNAFFRPTAADPKTAAQGFEPRLPRPERGVLPLHQAARRLPEDIRLRLGDRRQVAV